MDISDHALTLQARAVSVARSGALQQRDLVVAGLNPHRTLTEYVNVCVCV